MRKSSIGAITKLQVMVIAAILIVAVVGGSAYYFLVMLPASKGPIKVGLLLPWTGAGATQAAEIEKGVNIWAAEMKDEGGLLGREIQIVKADSESDPAKARIGYERLVSQDQVDVVIGPFYSSEFMAVLPLAHLYKVPTITPMGTSMAANPLMAEDNYVWRACGNNAAWVATVAGTLKDVIIPALIAEYGMAEGDIKIQLVRSDDEAARDNGRLLPMLLDTMNIKVQQLPEIVMSFSITDFTNEIRVIQDRKPDIVVGLAWGAQSAIFTKQTRDYNSHFIVMGFGDIATSPVFWDASKQQRVGMIGQAYYPIWTRLTDNTEPYVNAYIQTLGGTPSPSSGQGYDSALIYENAVKKAGTTDKEAVANAIAQSDFIGIKRQMKFVTDPAANDTHDLENAWYTMAQYQPTPSVIPAGNTLFNNIADGLRPVLIWPTSIKEGSFWIPEYYVPSTQQ